MTTPNYARLASKVLEEGGRSSSPPPAPQNRAAAIAALEQAIARRAGAKKRSRWAVTVVAAAAVVAATVGGARAWRLHGAPASAGAQASQDTGPVVGHTVAGAASVVVSGETVAVTDGRPIVPGSRVVTAPTGRLLLAFAAGVDAVLEEGGDVTLGAPGAARQVRLDTGSLDVHLGDPSSARFVVQTRDAEVEARGARMHVTVTPADEACGGTTTRVEVSDGTALVRHAGSETRVGAGERWPAGCAAPGGANPLVVAPVIVHGAPTPSAASTLGEQNDLFAQAIASKRMGDTAAALAGFDRFLARYPGSPLSESATVERMRLLRGSDPARATAAARAYLARYPKGFGHAEAEAILSGGR